MAWTAIAGQLLFIASWVVAGALQPAYSSWSQGVSELGALTAHDAWVANVAFFVLGLSFVALAPALRAVLPARRASAAAALLFAIAGVGLALSGVFRLDCEVSHHLCRARLDAGKLSWHTSAHLWVGVATSIALLSTPFAIARALGPSPTAAGALAAGGFGVLIAVAGPIAYGLNAPNGITERLQLLAAHLWVFLVAGGILHITRRAPAALPVTRLRPRDFFARSWAGEGELTAWPPLLGKVIRARFRLTRRVTFLSEDVWTLDDTATFPGGSVFTQQLVCQLEPSGRIRVSGDSVPGGCEVQLEDRGYRMTPYRYLMQIGPLHFTLRCRDEHRVQADSTLVSKVTARWLGIPVGLMHARSRRSDLPAAAGPEANRFSKATR